MQSNDGGLFTESMCILQGVGGMQGCHRPERLHCGCLVRDLGDGLEIHGLCQKACSSTTHFRRDSKCTTFREIVAHVTFQLT